MAPKTTEQTEFGDFQTPAALSALVMEVLRSKSVAPSLVVEPTCGIGGMLIAAYSEFLPQESLGIEINSEYVEHVRNLIGYNPTFQVVNQDIFQSLEWLQAKVAEHKTTLFVGNPPWVTSSAISAISGSNLPEKENLKGLKGLDAITGKSNFDISEYIILKLIERFHEADSVFSFLCKTQVARNLLKYVWDKSWLYQEASIYPIDSKKYFNAAVDACLFIFDFREKRVAQQCDLYHSIETRVLTKVHGYFQKRIVVDLSTFQSHNYMGKSEYVWRNGIKHDCSRVMELQIDGDSLRNGYGDVVSIENELVFPFLKSSDLSKVDPSPRKMVIVTQRKIGDSTAWIESKLPSTWSYLMKHRSDFENRKSSIYRNKPLFSIFSVGEYSFSPFKVAISGLYKKLAFQVISTAGGKPIMVDDTCNFIACSTEAEAHLVFELLTSELCTTFLNSIIFWDSKRPINTEVLNSIDLLRISAELGLEDHYRALCSSNTEANRLPVLQPMLL